MANYLEIDFIDLEIPSSGDGIAARYSFDGLTWIHIVDAGYQKCGEVVANYVQEYYGNGCHVDHVVATHSDADHCGGLRYVLENMSVGRLWLHRPWLHAQELLPRFETYTSADALASKLRSVYDNLTALETIALAKNIPISAPFQGAHIGKFTVMSPSKQLFLDLIVESEKTPEGVETAKAEKPFGPFGELMEKAAAVVSKLIAAVWGTEYFPPEPTSAENEMSVVQYAEMFGKKILLTGDAGRRSLQQVVDYAPYVGLTLPGIDRFQVPHHGSRHNVSIELLNTLLGPILSEKASASLFRAYVCAAKVDEKHPRKMVTNAIIHRGGEVVTTKTGSFRTHLGDAPERTGWGPVTPVEWSEEVEE